MCTVCGCSPSPELLHVEQAILSKHDVIAEDNRNYFNANNILALNLLSSPGSGKTTLLVETIKQLQSQYPISVIEGDQQSNQDADRIRATDTKVIQINTGKGCHLDAQMIQNAYPELAPTSNSILFIENVGNLVCPAGFDLGETYKVVMLSVTEGEDKPLKYPEMFHVANIVLLTKTDLLPYLDFDLDKCLSYIHRINPKAEVFQVSTRSGEGINTWLHWIKEHLPSNT